MRTLIDMAQEGAKFSRVTIADMRKKSKGRRVCMARALFIGLAYAEGYTCNDLAKFLNYKDHTPVVYHLKKQRKGAR